jgi:hypothetical protein
MHNERRAGYGLGATIKYLLGAAGIGLGTTIEYLRRNTSAAAGSGLGTTIKYLRQTTISAAGSRSHSPRASKVLCSGKEQLFIKYRNEGSSGAWFKRSELLMRYFRLGVIIIAGTCHEGRRRKLLPMRLEAQHRRRSP